MLAAVVFGVGGGVLMAACHGIYGWIRCSRAVHPCCCRCPASGWPCFSSRCSPSGSTCCPPAAWTGAGLPGAARRGSLRRQRGLHLPLHQGQHPGLTGEQYIVVAQRKGPVPAGGDGGGTPSANSLVPIITLIGNYFGGILGRSTIIENIFAIPGLGSYVLSAIQNRDYPVIQGYVLITGTTFVLVTLAIDLLYIVVNPKIRLQGGRHDKTPETEHQAGPRVRHPGAIVLMTIFAPWLAPMTPWSEHGAAPAGPPCRAHPWAPTPWGGMCSAG